MSINKTFEVTGDSVQSGPAQPIEPIKSVESKPKPDPKSEPPKID
jgi:hypothetical protein